MPRERPSTAPDGQMQALPLERAMPIAGVRPPDWTSAVSGLRWQDVAERTQAELAATLAAAMAEGRFDRAHYRCWLAVDSALSRTGALVLERLADWHGAQPPLRAAARSWAHDLREDAIAAAADLRTFGADAVPLPPVLAHWHGYAVAACGSPRAGEALGTVLLQGTLLHGPAQRIANEVMALPPLSAGRHDWLRRRQRAQVPDVAAARAELCAAWPASALATGARRARDWYRAALEAIPGLVAP